MAQTRVVKHIFGVSMGTCTAAVWIELDTYSFEAEGGLRKKVKATISNAETGRAETAKNRKYRMELSDAE